MTNPVQFPEPVKIEIVVRRRIGEYEHVEFRGETAAPNGSAPAHVHRLRTALALALDPSLAQAEPQEAQAEPQEAQAEPQEARAEPQEAQAEPDEDTPGLNFALPEPLDPLVPNEPETPSWEDAEAAKPVSETDEREEFRALFQEAATKKGGDAVLGILRPIFERHGATDGLGDPPIEAVREAAAALSELLSR